MTKEITIEDLAAESTASSGGKAAKAAADAAEGGDTGEWILELYERLEDDGMLQAIMFGPDALEPPEDAPDVDTAAADLADESGGVDVDAEVVADALEDVKDTVGDLRLSQLIKLTRENPGLVDNLLEEHLAADAAETEPLEPEDVEDED